MSSLQLIVFWIYEEISLSSITPEEIFNSSNQQGLQFLVFLINIQPTADTNNETV